RISSAGVDQGERAPKAAADSRYRADGPGEARGSASHPGRRVHGLPAEALGAHGSPRRDLARGKPLRGAVTDGKAGGPVSGFPAQVPSDSPSGRLRRRSAPTTAASP